MTFWARSDILYITVRKRTKEQIMSYVIYNRKTTKTLLAPARSVGCYNETYKSRTAAKAALTRLDNKDKLGRGEDGFPLLKTDFRIAEMQDFRANIEKTVTRTNAMTGKEFQEPINTPYSCSPSSENYWCS